VPAHRNGREDRSPGGEPPVAQSHYRPRTRAGRGAVAVFIALFALTQPPVVHGLANRITPWVLGVPFLYAYLLGLYIALIVVLVWAVRRGV